MTRVRDYIQKHFRHFNSAVVIDAARAWEQLLERGGKMFLSMAGAMSTAELGVSLAELVRADMLHAFCVTGANLEEDVFNLVAHESYERIPRYRDLRVEDEVALLERGMNRVTDTCIPEGEAVKRIEQHMVPLWQSAEARGESKFPHEYMYELLRSKVLEPYQIDPGHSWLIAACERDLPIWVPGWEDSTMGNIFVANVVKKELAGYSAIKHGLEQMETLMRWYEEVDRQHPVGFFQIGGGIAGDFSIGSVPLMEQDLDVQCRKWQYFCQISDSTTSYGSYSGAVPNEKITWGKLDASTPSFVIESDATIVFPLIAAYLLGR